MASIIIDIPTVDTRSAAEGLSVEQLTLLARVTVARVQIDKMSLKERPNTPVEKRTYKGRPPPAKTSKYGYELSFIWKLCSAFLLLQQVGVILQQKL